METERKGVISLTPQTNQEELERQIEEFELFYFQTSNTMKESSTQKQNSQKFKSVEEVLSLPNKGVDEVLETINEIAQEISAIHYTREEYLNLSDAELRSTLELFLNFSPIPITITNEISQETLLQNAKEISEKKNDYLVIITHPREFDKKLIDNYKKLLKTFVGKKLNVIISSQIEAHQKDKNTSLEYLFSKDEMNLLVDLDKFLKQNHFSPLKFKELENISHSNLQECWDIEMVAKANSFINKMVDTIKTNSLSPYEAVLYIHKIITENFTYKKSDNESSQTILGPFTEEEGIVCAGYASMMKAIIERLEFEGLSCDFANCRICGNNFNHLGRHIHNVIKINDSKYKIQGTFFEDTCWDANRTYYKDGSGFAHCLYPMCDVLYLENTKYIIEETENKYDQLVCKTDRYLKRLRTNKTYNILENHIEYLETEKILKSHSKKISIKKLEKGLQEISKIIPNLDVERELGKSIFIASLSFKPTAKSELIKSGDKLFESVLYTKPTKSKNQNIERFI